MGGADSTRQKNSGQLVGVTEDCGINWLYNFIIFVDFQRLIKYEVVATSEVVSV